MGQYWARRVRNRALYGGIHIAADDVEGRRIGAEVGLVAVARAFELFG